ncbi:unnamed protein product [Cunninghamella blakesleeana]
MTRDQPINLECHYTNPSYSSSIYSQVTAGNESIVTAIPPNDNNPYKKSKNKYRQQQQNHHEDIIEEKSQYAMIKNLQNHHSQKNDLDIDIEKNGKNITDQQSNKTPSTYIPKTYPIAWVALFFLVFLRTAISIYNNTFNPIPTVTATYLHVDLTSINWLFNIQAVVYIIVSFVTSWLFETLGVKKSLIIGGSLLTVGCWVRWIAVRMQPHSFALLMIGQVIAAISSPISLNIMTKFATVWFTENKRATAGMFVASNYGGIIAMFLMPAVATGADRIEFTVILVAVIATAATVPQFFLPALPPTPATPAEMNQEDSVEKVSLLKSTLSLMKNVHFWVLCGIHGINIGLSICWGGLFAQAVAPYGYSNSQAGNIVAIGIVAGTLGCCIAGPVLDATKKHTLFLKMMAPLVCSTYVALAFIIRRDSFASILYVNALNQFFLAFLIPVVIELGVEVTYPVPESVSTSILWQIAQAIGFVLVLVMDKFRDPRGNPPNNMDRGLIFQAATSGIIVILSFLYCGKMLRSEAYTKKQNSQSTLDDDNITITDESRFENENFQQYDDITSTLHESGVPIVHCANNPSFNKSNKPKFGRNDSNTDTINATEDGK